MQDAFNEAAGREVVSKAEFARRIGRSKGAVTGYVKEGKLSGAALVMTDKGEWIDLAEGIRQLQLRLDPVQRLVQAPPSSGSELPLEPRRGTAQPPADDDDNRRLLRSRVELSEMQALKARTDLLERNGEWMRTAEAREAWSRGLAELLALIEGGFQDLADDLLKVPAGDRKAMIVALRQGFRRTRERIAEQYRGETAAAPAEREAEELAA